MRQTAAIFLDAYRELNARKLFWVVLVISGLVVAAFGAVGLNESGVKLLVWQVDNDFFNSRFIPTRNFYRWAFVAFGIPLWLTWAATILALVSTASIFPDFVSGGAIELTLSKPIGRLRLFLTKYLSGLLFVVLQVLVFCGASFLVIGIRGGTWDPALFLAVPIVLVFFSYLFSVCALIGLLTRSTIAALLLTLLFWFACFLVHSTEGILLMFRIQGEHEVERAQAKERELEDMIESLRSRISGETTTRPEGEGAMALIEWAIRDGEDPEVLQARIEQAQEDLVQARAETEADVRSAGLIRRFHVGALAVKTMLPKTKETIDLLSRSLLSQEEIRQIHRADQEQADRQRENYEDLGAGEKDRAQRAKAMEEVTQELQNEIRGRSVFWIVGTSLLFESMILAIGAWIFCRRDF